MKIAAPSVPFSHFSRIYFIGIGGMVMSGLAELLQYWGKDVSGSERAANARTEYLVRLGIRCSIGETPNGISPSADCVVVSPRMSAHHPELVRARMWGLPLLTPAQLLGVLSRRQATIAVAGCHGKTTVGAYLGSVCERAGLDPSVVLRTPVEVWGRNVRCGRGDYLIIEADENEKRFLSLDPRIGVITNIEMDHLDYFGDLDALVRAYRQFAQRVCAHGTLIANRDDLLVLRALKGVKGDVIWFGKEEGAEVRALNARVQGGKTTFLLHIKRHDEDVAFDLAVPGQHQVMNALAVAAVCHHLKIPLTLAQDVFASYHGGERHVEVMGSVRGVTVIDDAADHPSEITSILGAIRGQYPGRAVWCVFQPYLINRAAYLAKEYAASFTYADRVGILPVVPGIGEKGEHAAAASASLAQLAAQYHTNVSAVSSGDALAQALSDMPHNAILVTLGADAVREHAVRFLQQKTA